MRFQANGRAQYFSLLHCRLSVLDIRQTLRCKRVESIGSGEAKRFIKSFHVIDPFVARSAGFVVFILIFQIAFQARIHVHRQPPV